MRIVATSDTHFSVDPATIPNGDVFVHAGDLLQNGYLPEWVDALRWLKELPHKTKIFVPGNHDFHLQVYPGPALQDMRKAGVTVVGFPGNTHFETIVLPNRMRLLGLPFVTHLPRWAFNQEEKFIEEYLARQPKCDIVVSHSPIRGVLDGEDVSHQGIECYRDYAQTHKPKFWFCGHMHEKYGHAQFDQTDVYNVAMCDINYRHTHKPVVVDV